jgi:hypothetical protein
MFNFIFKALKSAVSYIKSLFIEPKKFSRDIEMRTAKKLDYKQFHNPVTRPTWVKGLFDDYIYRRIKSLPELDRKIRERNYYERAARNSIRN